MIDKRFCLVADNGDRLYPYKKSQELTGRYGFALSRPGKRDSKGGGEYTTDLNEVIHRVVHDGWSVRAKTDDTGSKKRTGSFGFNKRVIVSYEISKEFEDLIKGAMKLPSLVFPHETKDKPRIPKEIAVTEVEKAPVPIDERIFREISTRRGQPAFRKQLLVAFDGKCCVTGSEVSDVLEAAHIIPFSESADYSVMNGLLLRSDIHTLFDLNLLKITPDGRVDLSKKLMNSEYQKFHGKQIVEKLPEKMSENLRIRYES